jgi:septal ring factor EnvC (AmiA/AmiB activator)
MWRYRGRQPPPPPGGGRLLGLALCIEWRRVSSRLVLITLVAGVLSVTLAACGESDAEKAKKEACNAKEDIAEQVRAIESYTLLTVTKDELEQNIDSIETDVQTIRDALPDLESSLKTQFTEATEAFDESVSELAATVGESISIEDATKQFNADRQQLEASYNQAFASVSCD